MVLLKAEHITKKYSGRTIIKDINIELHKGELISLLGVSGSSNGVALLDEPFSALDTITKTAIHRWYLEVMQHIDLSTIFITHDIDEAILLSDRIYILNGKPGEIRDEIIIKEKKPRAEDFYLTDEFLAYKREIIAKL